jgi:hypothetical protein
MIAFKKKAKTTKCSNHSTFSITAHTAKIAMGYLKEGLSGKLGMEMDLERKGTRDACRMLRIISE